MVSSVQMLVRAFWSHHNMASGIMAGAHLRMVRDHLVKQEVDIGEGQDIFFFDYLWNSFIKFFTKYKAQHNNLYPL